MKKLIRDGRYRVATDSFVAEFVVRDGCVAREDCDPLIWRRLERWIDHATYLGVS